MGEVADRLAALTVRVSSPDTNIQATARAGRIASIHFRPGSYTGYTENVLASQIARTATLLFVGHERGVSQIMEKAGLRRRKDPAQALDEAERRYLERAFAIEADGTGPQKLVRLRTVGMMKWECRIEPGTLKRLAEDRFLNELTAAGSAVLRRTEYEAAILKDECFGLGIPELAEERRRRSQASARRR